MIRPESCNTRLAGLERRHGGRLGVAILDSAGVSVIAHRGDERFALCSTFKFLAAAFVLARVDRKQESLTRRIVYRERLPGSVFPRNREARRRERPDCRAKSAKPR